MPSDAWRGQTKRFMDLVHRRWKFLTLDDLQEVSRDWDELSRRLQRRYGFTQREASKETEDFFSTLTA